MTDSDTGNYGDISGSTDHCNTSDILKVNYKTDKHLNIKIKAIKLLVCLFCLGLNYEIAF